MKQLNPRLLAIAQEIKSDSRVADIGTDHGYLPIFLVKNGIASKVYACDIRQKPLANAKANIAASRTENIELLLCDGLEGVDKKAIDTAVIAGMGGDVISGIIERCSWIKSDEYTLILQPMTGAAQLRRYLCEKGFSIILEKAVREGRRIYTVIKAVYIGITLNHSPAFYYIGALCAERQDDRDYMLKQLKIIEECCQQLKYVPEKQAELSHFLAIKDEIKAKLGN